MNIFLEKTSKCGLFFAACLVWGVIGDVWSFGPAWNGDPAAGAKEAVAAGPVERYEPGALPDLLERVKQAKAQGKRPAVIFDIDDTLVDTGGRHKRILKEFIEKEKAEAAEMEKSGQAYPYMDELAKLEDNLDIQNMKYDILDTARAAGVPNPELLDRLKKFWLERFFTGEYAKDDPLVPGAARYVQGILAKGGVVIYMTGRSEGMAQGTLESFEKNGFPKPDNVEIDKSASPAKVKIKMSPMPTNLSVYLLMKQKKQSDVEFKNEQMDEMKGNQDLEVIGGFENEPKNINAIRAKFPDGTMIFVDTKNSGAKDPSTGRPYEVEAGVLWVKDFN